MLSKPYRFHGHGSLRYVYKNGQAVRGKYLTIKYSPNPRRTKPRVAVVVSKKVFKSAVKRNKVRRRVFEAIYKLDVTQLKVCDIAIIVTSSELLALSQPAIEELFRRFVDEAKLYKTDQ